MRAGVGLLMIEIGVGLCESGLRGAAPELRRSAVALTVSPCFWRSVSTVSLSLDFWLAAVASAALRAAARSSLSMTAIKLACLHVLAFVDGERLNAAGNFGADDNFVGVDGADQLEVLKCVRSADTRPGIPA